MQKVDLALMFGLSKDSIVHDENQAIIHQLYRNQREPSQPPREDQGYYSSDNNNNNNSHMFKYLPPRKALAHGGGF